MTGKTKTLQPVTPSKTEAPDNGWEALHPFLAPEVVHAPHLEHAWEKLDRYVVTYLTNTVARNKYPWLNHLSLAAVVYCQSGVVQPASTISTMNSFLRWAIPTHYPTVASLDPAEAVIAYYGDPPQARGRHACDAYSGLQLHMQPYLDSLSPDEHKTLAPFVFPPFLNTPKLARLSAIVFSVRQAKRKEQAWAVVHDLVSLVALGRQRYKWLADLDAQVQQAAQAVASGQATLPAVIHCRDLDNREKLVFRVWNRESWTEAHQKQYDHDVLKYTCDANRVLFLQLVGPLPDSAWFLRAVEIGALGRYVSPAARDYLRRRNLALFHGREGLLLPGAGLAHILTCAQLKASGAPDDSRVLFCIEPLLAAAALGLFALVCFTQTAMRIGELQQLAFDETCIRTGHFPQVADGQTTGWSEERMFWYLYPKGSTDRQPYMVTTFMQEALTLWMQTHERFCGHWKTVLAYRRHFTHARRFPGRYKFALQWKGGHLANDVIEACLNFVLLEHTCLDAKGHPVRITAHVLRHGVAGYLRNKGVPLEDIMALLKQINIAVTDYYSKPSPHDLYTRIGPMLTRLGELAEIDPATIRTEDDLNHLIQAALKRFGILCQVPGGSCCSFESCEVLWRCPACSSYVPDPARRHEVDNQMTVCQKAIQLFEAEGDLIQAGVQRARLHSWGRVRKELDALASVQFEIPPLSKILQDQGVHPAAEELRALPKSLPQLPGESQHD